MGEHYDVPADEEGSHPLGICSADDPGAIGAFKPWVDISGSPWLLKVRNAANDGWEILGVVVAYPVTSVFGRTGAVVAAEGDYTLDQLAGVVITAAGAGEFLRHNGTNWVNATLVAGDIPDLNASKITAGVFDIARLATGTPDGTKFVRDDGTLAVPTGVGAPADVEYLVGASDGDLSAERVVTDTATVTWDLTTPGQAKAQIPSDVALPGNPTTTTQSLGNDTTRIATTAFVKAAVDAAITAIKNGVASAFDTLAEIATELGLLDGRLDTLEVDAYEEVLEYALSDETTELVAGVALTARVPYACTLTGVRGSLVTTSSAGDVEVDIKESGSTIFSTLLTIDQGDKTSVGSGTTAVISDSALADDAELIFEIVDPGADATGLKVKLYVRRTP